MIWVAVAAVASTACLPMFTAAAGPAGHSLVWGLDLGNDNIVVAVASRNGVDVVTNNVSGRQTPSAIYFAGDHRLIGENSAGHAGSNPSNLVNQVKRLLGGDEEVDDAREDRDRRQSAALSPSGVDYGPGSPSEQRKPEQELEEQLPRSSSAASDGVGRNGASRDFGFSATPSPSRGAISGSGQFNEIRRGEDASGRQGLQTVVRHGGEELRLSASEVVAYLFRHCADMVRRSAKGDGVAISSSCVVASVPSHFSVRQRRAVIDAASIADLTMPLVIDEGTAVALAYGVLKGGLPPAETGRPLVVAFVDIGHSCTQVTIASFTASGLEVVGRGCERECGTAAVQASVFDRVCDVASEQGMVVKGRPRSEFHLAEAVTAAMKTLSANTEARLNVDCIDGEKDLSMALTRKEVEAACVSVAEGVSTACEEALRAAGIAVGDVHDVELLGGGSYVPALRRSVESIFGGRVRRTMSSSESVARGCALAAAQHSSLLRLRPFRVVDRLPRGLRAVWRYCPDPYSPDSSSTQNASQSNPNPDESNTGKVDIPVGTAIPWSSGVPINLGGSAGGVVTGKVHVHLMEGVDLLGSYVIDVSSTKGGWVGGRGKAGGMAGAGGRVVDCCRLEFVLRVDDGGMPSVQAARLEYEEEVTEFVEILEAKIPSTVPPQRSKDDEKSADSPEELDDSALKASSSDREAGTGGEGKTNARKDGKENMAAGVEIASEDVIREDATPSNSSPNGSAGVEASDGRSVDDVVDGDYNELQRDSEVSRSGVAGNAGSDTATAEREGEGKAEEQDTSIDSEAFMNGEGEPRRSARAKARGVKKVPRVVKRSRSRVLKVEKTYTGILEGLALEEARERERSLRRQDEAVRSANEARNALENLIYATRSSLEPGEGDLSAFVKPAEAAAILSSLEETEDWLYACSPQEGTLDKLPFEMRASSLEARLSEVRSRKQARVNLLAALGDAEAAALEGKAQLAEARDGLSAAQRRHAENELSSIRRVVADARRKLDAAAVAEKRHEYGSLLGGRLPIQEGNVRKKMERLSGALSFVKMEHS